MLGRGVEAAFVAVAFAAGFLAADLTVAVVFARVPADAATARPDGSSTVTSIPWSPMALRTAFHRAGATPAASRAWPTA